MNIEVNASVSNHEKNPKNFVVVKDKLGDEQVKIFETAGGEEQGFVPMGCIIGILLCPGEVGRNGGAADL